MAVTALFALLLQIVLSFGHVHIPHATGAGGPIAVAAITPDTGGAGGSRQPDGGHRHDDGYCAICAVMTLLSGAQAATAPLLPPLHDPISVEITVADAALGIASEHVAFRSRAPPHS
jgi:hypothetical protein